MSVPTEPVIRPRPKATDGTLEFWWAPPTSDGGSPVTGYTIEIPGVYVDTVGPATGYYKITGLTNGTPYRAQVNAVNANGAGALAYFRTVEPGLLPSAPQTQAATRTTATNTTISWTAPSSDGGATVGWNVITCYPLDSSGAVINRNTLAAETSLGIPDLSANTAYTVLVRARNDPGYSPKAIYIAPLIYGPKPQDISGLRLWLDAADLTTLFSDAAGTVRSSLETSQVRVWKDKSGLGHDASGGLVRRLIAGINGQRYPCIQFTAGNNLVTSSFSASNTNSITVFLVGQMADLATNNQALYSSSSNALFITLDTSRGINLLFNADGGTMLSAPTDAFISIQKATTTDVITTILSPTYSTHTDGRSNLESLNTASVFTLGANSVDVRISELLIWDRVLSDGEQGRIATYLQQKWGFAGLPAPIVYLVAADLGNGDTTWYDRSGNGWNADLSGGTSAKNGANALVLDGASFWTFGDIGLQTNFSVSAWFKRTAAIGEGGCIVSETYTGGNYVNLAIYGGTYGASDTEFIGGFFSGDWRVGAPQAFTLNTWTHIVVTWDGTNVKTYIDGSLVDTTDQSSYSTGTTGLGYNIGKRWDLSSYVTGDLGEVRIDGVALTDAQVAYYYATTSGNYGAGPAPVPPTFEISLYETAPLYQDGTLNFTATQTGGDSYTYTNDNWLLDSNAFQSNTNQSLVAASVPMIGNHTMTYEITTAEFGTISATNSVPFTILPVITPSSTNIFEGDTVYFTVDLTNNGDYNNDFWYINDTNEGSSTNGSWSYQFNTAGTYNVTYQFQNTSIESFSSAAIVINVSSV